MKNIGGTTTNNAAAAAAAIAFVVTVASMYVTWRFMWYRNNQGSRRTFERSDDDDDDNEVDPTLMKLFEKAANQISSLTIKSNTDKLLLYGLFKQATEGDVTKTNKSPPSKLDMVNTAKYNAWYQFDGTLTKKEAMIQYISTVATIQKQPGSMTTSQPSEIACFYNPLDIDDIVYSREDELLSEDELDDDDDDEDTANNDNGKDDDKTSNTGTSNAMGLRKSTLTYDSNTGKSIDLPSQDSTTTSSDGNDKYSSDTKTTIFDSLTNHKILENELITRRDLRRTPSHSWAVNTRDEEYGQTPLHLAVDQGLVEAVHILIKWGANVNAIDNDGISVLQTAMECSYEEDTTDDNSTNTQMQILKALLEAGADPNLTPSNDNKTTENDKQPTPYQIAIDEQRDDLIELFDQYATSNN